MIKRPDSMRPGVFIPTSVRPYAGGCPAGRGVAVAARAGAGSVSYTHLDVYKRQVYDGLRRAIPVIDAAIDKIGRLVGGCAPVCSNRAAPAELEAFFRGVPVGAVSWGMESFVRCYLAVSYTQLDVYKRQGFEPTTFGL